MSAAAVAVAWPGRFRILGSAVSIRRRGACRLAVAVLAILALQQRVALELAVHEGVELEVAQLQQLDGLLQLRRDDQPLALP